MKTIAAGLCLLCSVPSFGATIVQDDSELLQSGFTGFDSLLDDVLDLHEVATSTPFELDVDRDGAAVRDVDEEAKGVPLALDDGRGQRTAPRRRAGALERGEDRGVVADLLPHRREDRAQRLRRVRAGPDHPPREGVELPGGQGERQLHDLARAFAADGARWQGLRIDGGMSANDWMAQDLADMLAIEVERPAFVETTALGAAMLAAVGAGLHASLADAAAMRGAVERFSPAMDIPVRDARLAGWATAMSRTLTGI